jgi:PAS domain-containing protein
VYAWLQGVEPRHDALRRLAADLECNVEWLLSGEQMEIEAHAQGARSGPTARSGRRVGGNTFRIFDAAPIRALREVTERLERLEAGLQAFFDIYPDFLLWLDSDGTILSATHGKGFEPVVPAQEQIGKRQWDLVPPRIGRMWKAALAYVRQTGRPYVLEMRMPIKGKLRTRECRLVPIARQGYLAMIRDITELRDLQEKSRGRKPAGGAQ